MADRLRSSSPELTSLVQSVTTRSIFDEMGRGQCREAGADVPTYDLSTKVDFELELV